MPPPGRRNLLDKSKGRTSPCPYLRFPVSDQRRGASGPRDPKESEPRTVVRGRAEAKTVRAISISYGAGICVVSPADESRQRPDVADHPAELSRHDGLGAG